MFKKIREIFRGLAIAFVVLAVALPAFTGCFAAPKSAYDLAVENGFIGSEAEWLDSLKSAPGLSAYELAVASGYTGTLAEWLASLQGASGLSAYELALANGFVGTEAEWLALLQVDLSALKSNYAWAVESGLFDGTPEEWLESLKSKSAYESAVANGFTGTEAEWIRSLNAADTLYALYQAEHPDKTLDDFLAEFFVFPSNTVTVHKALRSAVSILAGVDEGAMAGAGVIMDIDAATGEAYIITNYHVLYEGEISSDIRIAPFGGEWFGDADGGGLNLSIAAEFVGGSITKDIAVIKTEANEVLKNGTFRAADIGKLNQTTVGETVFAIGNPEGVGLSATMGIVNVDSEYIRLPDIAGGPVDVVHRVLRVDAAINGGNSGGGLYNTAGELIGIVNAKSVSSTIDNMGYAIPVSVASGVYNSVRDNVKEGGKFAKYLIGITTQIVSSHAVLDGGVMRVEETLEIVEIGNGVPSAGIVQLGDVVLKAKLADLPELILTRNFMLSDYIFNARAGDGLVLTVIRAGEVVTLPPIIIRSDSYAEL